jgi:hypothetical protein
MEFMALKKMPGERGVSAKCLRTEKQLSDSSRKSGLDLFLFPKTYINCITQFIHELTSSVISLLNYEIYAVN